MTSKETLKTLEVARQIIAEALDGLISDCSQSADNIEGMVRRCLFGVAANAPKLHVPDIKFHIENEKRHLGELSIVADNIYTAALMMNMFIDPSDIKDQNKYECDMGTFIRENGKIMYKPPIFRTFVIKDNEELKKMEFDPIKRYDEIEKDK